MELIVFTNNGQTFMFKGVQNFTNTTTGFKFDYFGQMTQVQRQAVFNNTCVAGYAMKDEPRFEEESFSDEEDMTFAEAVNTQVSIDDLNAMIDK